MKISTLWLSILLCSTILSINARDFGTWRKGDIIRKSWLYIQRTKIEFHHRANAVKNETDEVVTFKYTHFHNMNKKELRFHDKFLEGRLSTEKIHIHINAFLRDLENNRKVLAIAEVKAEESWDKKHLKENVTILKSKTGRIYETEISAKRLGVIIDTSTSMSPYLLRLRATIKNKFPNAYFIEIYGCLFRNSHKRYGPYFSKVHWYYIKAEEGENPFQKKFYCQQIPDKNIHSYMAGLKQGNVHAMCALALSKKVDAIYWFSDMKDPVIKSDLKTLTSLLKKTNLKIYAHTTFKSPTKPLRALIRDSGGEFIREKIK